MSSNQDMRCDQIKRSFSPYFDGQLDPRDQVVVTGHLETCTACGAEYADFERVFRLVRLVPAITTEAAAPRPETATRFSPPSTSRFSWWKAAAMIVACSVVGTVAYKYGQRVPGPFDRRETIHASMIPSKPAGQRLRRLTNQTENVARLVDMSGHSSDSHTADLLGAALRSIPIVEDARRLRDFDEDSLGSFKDPVHELAASVQVMMVDVVKALDRRDVSPRDRIRQVRRMVFDSRFGTDFEKVHELASRYDPLPFAPQVADERFGEDLTSRRVGRAMLYYITGEDERAFRELGSVRFKAEWRMPHFFQGVLSGRFGSSVEPEVREVLESFGQDFDNRLRRHIWRPFAELPIIVRPQPGARIAIEIEARSRRNEKL